MPKLGPPEMAEAQLRAAVALAPLYVQARNELAKFYFDAGRYAEAEQQFRSSVSSGGTTQAWSSLGEIYISWKRWQDADHAFRQAVALDPFNSAARFGLGEVRKPRAGAARPSMSSRQVSRLTPGTQTRLNPWNA